MDIKKMNFNNVFDTVKQVAKTTKEVLDKNALNLKIKEIENRIVEHKYNIGKNSKVCKIKELLIEIGDKVVKKNIEIKDKNILAEIACINELQTEINALK